MAPQQEIPGENGRKRRAQRRNLVSSFFVTVLISIAYREAISDAAVWVKMTDVEPPVFLENMLLLLTFFLVSMRFFVGNQLHLLSDSLVRLPGLVWLYDVMFIITQSVILIFLGDSSSLEANRNVSVGFIEFLTLIYLVDVAWVLTQWLSGMFFQNWERELVPWGWAVLNAALLVGMFLLSKYSGGPYSLTGLVWLCGMNAVAFVLDIVLLDQYGALE